MPPLVLLSGFGPYEDVERNPSAELALHLARVPPPGLDVRSAELPTSFERAPEVWDGLAASVGRDRPALCLALGAARRERVLRLERRARGRLENSARQDVDGGVAAGAGSAEADLATSLDLDGLAATLAAEGHRELRISDDAGGYVCERLYHHVLSWAREAGSVGLFLHVPPFEALSLRRQVAIVGRLLQVVVGVQSGTR